MCMRMCILLTTYYLLPRVLLTTHYSLLTTHYSLLTNYLVLTSHYVILQQWAIFKTSALKGDGLYDGMDWLVNALREGNK